MTIKTFNEFQPLALRTESHIDSVVTDAEVLDSTLQIFIASSEILDAIKKQVFYKKNTKLLTEAREQVSKLEQEVIRLRKAMDAASEDTLTDTIPFNPRVFHGTLGLVTEAGEIGSIIQKVSAGGELDVVNLQEEATGDSGWYRAILNDELGLDEYQGLTNVINKLRVRYPERYSDEAAANRDLESERKHLEVGIKEQ